MKRKGFTLIELLAVIVILAVISLISTPMILGVIETAKENSAKVSANGYIDAVEKQIAFNMIDSTKKYISDGIYPVSKLSEEKYGVKVKGQGPEDGWIKITSGEVVEYSLKIGEYVINYNGTETTITKGGEIIQETQSGPTKEEASETDTHRGIVYLDPTDLTKTCTKEIAESNVNENGTPTEIKTGCMKWYIYSEDESNYTMILDHNTTARIKWNDDSKNVSYEESNLYAVVENLKKVSGWKVNPRVISVEEINIITGKTDCDSTKYSSWYYLDTLIQTSETFTETKRSKYDWLYNNLVKCKTDSIDHGCTIEDNNLYIHYGTAENGNTFGYWTSTTVGISGSDLSVWRVGMSGDIIGNDVTNKDHGIRPVITISKSIIG